ncbi:glycosyltransferase family 1 protein [Sphingomonas ursincola]|uniref:Glycosyltransferase family 1 protein n=1 Tax=Sphingomonas ursincola TaxID=56361 RepID=A0A7V8RG96_9SPHN|nr:glycosyltransferase family 1 protein [Sphingomonas ursincola]
MSVARPCPMSLAQGYDSESLRLRTEWGFRDCDFTAGKPALERPPRVALFSGNYNYLRDGANQALNRLVRHLRQRLGAQVRVYSPTGPTAAFEPEGQLVSVPSIPIPGRSEYRLALGLPKHVRADLAAFAPDIVHLSAPDLLGSAAGRWARSRSVPLITSLHTRFETYLEYYGLRWARPLAARHLARFYALSDYLLVPTRHLLDEMTVGRSDGRVRLWSRGVDHTVFNPNQRDPVWRREQGYDHDDPVVMFFSRLVLEKGIDIFIETVRALVASGRPIRPLIVGEGPARARLEDELPDAVFTGHLTGLALGRAVASADIMIMPSRTEAFGNVVLEAMAAGVAIVSADTPSARHLVRDGETGLLCPPTRVAAYVAAVHELIESRARRQNMASAAQAASRAHGWDRSLDDALDTYREALAASGRLAGSSRSTWREDGACRFRLEGVDR